MPRHRSNDPSAWSLHRAPSRSLQVLVDRDTVADLPVVLGLHVNEDGIAVEQYRDNGPPADVAMSPDGFMPPTAIGWVTVGPPADAGDPLSGRFVRTATEETVSESSLREITVGYLRIVLDDVGGGVSDESALLFAVARELGVDLLITARNDLLDSPLAQGTMQLRTPAGAVPVVALYLRGTERGVIAFSPNLTETVMPSSPYFYRVADEYLPLLDSVEGRLRADSAVSGVHLVQALRRKLGFALMRRDMVWRLMLQHPTLAQLEEMAAEVDSFLLFLTAAMDAAARLLDDVLDLKTRRERIGFQTEEWRQKVSGTDAITFDEAHVNVVSAITGLRNFTHGTGTRALPVDVGKHNWKKTTTYLLYERRSTTPDKRWRDPVDAFWALRDSPFRTPSVDMWQLGESADVFVTPGPMCDVLVGGGLAILGLAVDALASHLGVERPPDEGGLRIRPHIRTEQIHAFMAIPGFGEVEFL